MRLTTASPTPIRVPLKTGTDDGELFATVVVATVADVDRISHELAAANLSPKEQATELQLRVIAGHVQSIEGLEVDGVFVADPKALLAMRERLPAQAGSLFSALFLAAMGGPALHPSPSKPRSA